ncbi:DUF1822 family protein [Desmonostoc muscorum LEGE 12446]|uniref:DUF1822 family protein n=1 Tax=Desmonostoc muscorum LEGE 12446 TaxID=1828758 RepID=A0A8J6ZKI4_DESMC|nr:DUF1822 family protein [Desmonostoc muscorum]MCF2152121.1 DUF1822 family protein [Desmonostoc muscorum LEGE 12446]
MNFTRDRSLFKVSLTRLAHQFARRIAQQQSQPQKSQQVYLNNLAIYAVNYYFQCLGIETEVRTSLVDIQAHDCTEIPKSTVVQTLSQSAALEVKNKGKIECRPVLPNSQFCDIPAEVWSNQIGYVAVLLNLELTEANLLGFVQAVETEQFPLAQLQPLENLLDSLSQIQPVVLLQEWFEQKFAVGWQSLENLLTKVENSLQTSSANFAYSFRHRSSLNKPDVVEGAKAIVLVTSSESSEGKIPNFPEAKLIESGIKIKKQSLILLIAITPENEEKTGIQIQLHASPEEKYLADNIHLELLSPTGETVRSVVSHAYDNWIQLPYLKCIRGETFSIRITLDNIHVSETFKV